MNEVKPLSEAERHKILDRRKKNRALGLDPNFKERRKSQICLVCHSPFAPTSSGQIICPGCQLDGTRGGRKGSRDSSPF